VKKANNLILLIILLTSCEPNDLLINDLNEKDDKSLYFIKINDSIEIDSVPFQNISNDSLCKNILLGIPSIDLQTSLESYKKNNSLDEMKMHLKIIQKKSYTASNKYNIIFDSSILRMYAFICLNEYGEYEEILRKVEFDDSSYIHTLFSNSEDVSYELHLQKEFFKNLLDTGGGPPLTHENKIK
jgi:hypothetical protein